LTTSQTKVSAHVLNHITSKEGANIDLVENEGIQLVGVENTLHQVGASTG
jgi:hypothetical protein